MRRPSARRSPTPRRMLGPGLAVARASALTLAACGDPLAGPTYLGTATFALSLTTLLLGLTTGQKGLWHTPLVRAEFALAALSLACFIWWERRTRYPLLDLGLFRIRLFAAG